MNKSDSIKEIATALCKFQGEVGKIKKTETNPFFHNKYADLSSILDVIRMPLANNNLSIVQFPVGKCELETVLMHTSGEWMSATYEMKPTKDDPQGAGSVITYQRRYALGAVLGLNIDIDDDGNKGSEPVRNEPKKQIQKAVVLNETPKESSEIDQLRFNAILELEKCQSRADITKVFNNYPKLQADDKFISECRKVREKIESLPKEGELI